MRLSRSRALMPSGGQPAARAASASGGGAATASAASSRSIAARTSGGRPAAAAGIAQPVAVAGQRPVARSPSIDDGSGDARRPPRDRASRSRRARERERRAERRAARRPGDAGSAAWCARDGIDRGLAERRLRRPARAGRPRDRRARRGGRAARPGATRRRASAAARSAVDGRRREIAARRRRVEDHAAARGRAGRRLAEREPVARPRPRSAGASRRIASDAPSGEVDRLARPAHRRARRPGPCRGGAGAGRDRPGCRGVGTRGEARRRPERDERSATSRRPPGRR